jgi:hypothetical protein
MDRNGTIAVSWRVNENQFIANSPIRRTNEEYMDTCQLLGGARSRSSSIMSASSDASSALAQGQVQRCIDFFAKRLLSLASFTIVQRLYSLFERMGSMIATYQSNSRFYGWRMGVLIGCCMSATILLFNIAVVIIVAIKTDVHGDTAQLPFKYDSLTMCVFSPTNFLRHFG